MAEEKTKIGVTCESGIDLSDINLRIAVSIGCISATAGHTGKEVGEGDCEPSG